MSAGRRSLIAVLAGMTAILVLAGGRPQRASASCVSSVTYLGASYLGVDALAPADVAGRVGPGSLPACDDVVTIPPRPPEPPTAVAVHRVRGVAPRLAVAVASGGQAVLYVPEGVGCRSATTDALLACLRRRTARLVEGPSLIAPPSARAGDVVGLAVHVRSPALRRTLVFGIDALLQESDGVGWRSLYHLVHPSPGSADPPAPVVVAGPWARISVGLGGEAPRPVRLPDVAPGAYRLAKRVRVGGRSRWLFAPLSILPP